MATISKKVQDPEVLRFIQDDEAESLSPQEILTWAIKNFQPGIALSCSLSTPIEQPRYGIFRL